MNVAGAWNMRRVMIWHSWSLVHCRSFKLVMPSLYRSAD